MTEYTYTPVEIFFAGIGSTIPFVVMLCYIFYNKGFTKGVELAEENIRKNGGHMTWPWQDKC